MPQEDDTWTCLLAVPLLTYLKNYKQKHINLCLFQIRMSLSEQKDANMHLQTYIDNVLSQHYGEIPRATGDQEQVTSVTVDMSIQQCSFA